MAYEMPLGGGIHRISSKGLNPGPTVFLSQPELVYAIIFSFFIANLLMIPMGFVVIKLARHVVRVPRAIMMPLVLVFSAIGAFAATNSEFSIGVLVAMGILGWLMEANGVPVAPAVLGLILGPMIEEHFLTSLMKSRGELWPFFERPVAGALGAATVAVLVLPPLVRAARLWQARG